MSKSEVIFSKEYHGFESFSDYWRDMDEAVQPDFNSKMLNIPGEFSGTIKVTIEYIESPSCELPKDPPLRGKIKYIRNGNKVNVSAFVCKACEYENEVHDCVIVPDCVTIEGPTESPSLGTSDTTKVLRDEWMNYWKDLADHYEKIISKIGYTICISKRYQGEDELTDRIAQIAMSDVWNSKSRPTRPAEELQESPESGSAKGAEEKENKG